MKTNIEYRKEILGKCKRIVVKAGTRLLTDENQIPRLISQISHLRNKGIKVILVSSGAVGLGMKTLNLKKRPSKLSYVQSLAAIGQTKLMALYEKACTKAGFHSAQLLLTADDLRDRERHLNVQNCLNSLLSQNILPIVNENDPVSIDELKFGDNDILASLLATLTCSELTVILTTVDGFHYVNDDGEFGERVSVIKSISDEMRSAASGTDNAAMSIGGMKSKLRAAEIATSAGEYLWLADGRDPDIIQKVFAAEDVGTLFLPRRKKMDARRRWIGIFSRKCGKLTIDDGATEALLKGGRSLLPSGITGAEGNFKRGDTVEITDAKGIVIARGLSNYKADDCRLIMGFQSSEISKKLKQPSDEAVVHRNNLFVIKK